MHGELDDCRVDVTFFCSVLLSLSSHKVENGGPFEQIGFFKPILASTMVTDLMFGVIGRIPSLLCWTRIG
jgi:hypothetical protein